MDNQTIIETIKGLASAISGQPLEIRTGDAVELHEPEKMDLAGVIDSPYKWLEKKVKAIDQTKAHIRVNREYMSIALVVDEHSYYSDIITGKLEVSPEYKKFGINSGEYKNGVQMSDLVRMNRSYFESKDTAMKLVTLLRNFKANVNKDIEASQDTRGNKTIALRQAVESNLPPAFDICIPLFRGGKKVRFSVEVDIDPDSLGMTLVSPDANDLIEENRDKIMDKVLGDITEIAPDIAIIEI